MGLNVYLNRKVWISYDGGKTHETKDEEVFSGGTTHNLTEMADKAGIYEALWRPFKLHKDWVFIPDSDYQKELEFEKNHPIKAKDLIIFLENGLRELKSRPEYFKQFNSPNGWGLYKHFVPFVESYLNACKEYPDAIVETCR